MFNRPGPRLVDALEWLAAMFHGCDDVCPPGFPYEWLDTKQKASEGERRRKKATGASSGGGAPDMTDIEDAHRCAVDKGSETYIDPRTGYTVFTQLAALKRGKCCGSGCRHCPYSHDRVPAARKARLPPPIVDIR